ncbi:MAG: hypothetical protein ACRDYC_10675, partial [Acidimicrobiales bacterium]
PRGVPLVAAGQRGVHQVATALDLDEALDAFAGYVVAQPEERLRIGVGDADAAREGAALADRLRGLSNVAEVVRYRCGPSVLAYTGGLGTFGAVLHPLF